MLSSRKKPLRLPQDLRTDALWDDVKQYVISSAMKPPDVDLAVSPCERQLAWVATADGASHLVLFDLESNEITRASPALSGLGKLQWCVDSLSVVCLCDAGSFGSPQLWRWDVRNGTLSALTNIVGTVEDFQISPDGERVLVKVASPESELSGVEGSGRVRAVTSSVESWMPSVYPSAGYAPSRKVGTFNMPKLQDGTANTSSSIADVTWIPSNWNVWDAIWCGDAAVLAVVSMGGEESAWYGAKLVMLDPIKGDLTVVADGARQFGCIAVSASGQNIAFVEALGSDRYIVAGPLYVVNRAQCPNLSARLINTLDTDVTYVQWQSENTLVFAGLRGLRTVVGSWDAISGVTSELWVTDETCGSWLPTVAAGRTRIALTRHSYSRIPEFGLLEHGQVTRVATQSHDPIVNGGSVTEHHWKSRDGIEVEGLLCVPEGDGPHPLVVLVHGGPVFAFRNSWVMQYGWTPLLVQQGYAVLHPNPRGSFGRGTAFLEMILGDMGGEDAYDITMGIDYLVKKGIVSEKRVAIMGRSYGGFMAAWMITQTDRFAAAISMAPVTNWINQHFNSNIGVFDELFLGAKPFEDETYLERSPLRHVSEQCITPILIIAGSEDRCTPPAQAIEFHQALTEVGCSSQLVIYPGEGHHARSTESRTDLLTRVLLWLRFHLA